MQFEELGNMAGKKLMLLPGTCCDWQTNFGTVIDSLSYKTIKDADHILVISDGKIVERGDHKALMDMNGEYAHMVELQAS